MNSEFIEMISPYESNSNISLYPIDVKWFCTGQRKIRNYAVLRDIGSYAIHCRYVCKYCYATQSFNI
jgi:hypothetical protein